MTHMITRLALIFAVISVSTAAGAADISRACDAARRADRHYTDNNAGEAAIKMGAWETATQAEIEGGKQPNDPDHIRQVVEDIMSFGMQSTDEKEGRRTLKDFIKDACE